MPVINGSMGKIVASIVSTFDAKGVKQAEKSLHGFDALAKKLGKTLGVSLGAAAIVSFGKQAVHAFSESEKAANQLGMALVSIGKASEYISTTHFLNSLQDTTGILKENLIPAMNSLLVQTQNVTEAQKLLGIATDVSASGAADLQSVSVALGKAYNGNLTSLAKLNIGITQNEAKTMSYAQAVKYLANFYEGDAARAADTFAGKMNLVKAATSDAMASIGSGIVEGIQTLSGSTKSIENIINGIRNIGFVVGQEIAGLAIGLKKIFDGIAANPVFKAIAGALGKGLSFLGKKTGITDAIKKDLALGKAKQLADEKAKQAQLLALERSRLRTQKESLGVNKLNADALKKAIMGVLGGILGNAQDLFNLDNIELAAAMMNKQTEEDMARLKLKKDIADLEAAINAGNLDAATQIAERLAADAEAFGQLRQGALDLKGIDPFGSWLHQLQLMIAMMEQMASLALRTKYLLTDPIANTSLQNGLQSGLSLADALSGARYAGQGAAEWNKLHPDNPAFVGSLPKMANGGIVTQATPVIAGEAGAEAIIPLSQMGNMNGGITVNVAGSVITQQHLLDAISQGLQNQGASGRPTTFNRLNSPYIA